MMTVRRMQLLAGVLAAFALGACGDGGSGDASTTATPPAPPAEAVARIEGYLVSADEKSVLLRTQTGQQTFVVAPADLESVGIPHLASHAGLTDIGFRVYYEEQNGTRYIKGSEEIAPPF